MDVNVIKCVIEKTKLNSGKLLKGDLNPTFTDPELAL